MNIKKSILSLGLAIAIAAPSFANTPASKKPEQKAIKKIESIIKKIEFNKDVYTDLSFKIKFMVNEDNEVIVLSTYNSEYDNLLKSSLNYKNVDQGDLTPYKVYILPVKFTSA